ncbi:spore cortex biosynthesis protein YabQ [Sporosarcina sp. CAU 1771]
MSLSVQFLSLLAMIGTGIVAAAFLDMIGTWTAHSGRTSFIRRRASWFEFIGWVIVGCWTFYILFLVRDGAWRIYDPFAQLSGMLLYISFFYKPFRFIGKIVLLIFIKPFLFIIKFIVTVIRQVILFIVKVITLLFRPFVRLFRKYFTIPFNKRRK